MSVEQLASRARLRALKAESAELQAQLARRAAPDEFHMEDLSYHEENFSSDQSPSEAGSRAGSDMDQESSDGEFDDPSSSHNIAGLDKTGCDTGTGVNANITGSTSPYKTGSTYHSGSARVATGSASKAGSTTQRAGSTSRLRPTLTRQESTSNRSELDALHDVSSHGESDVGDNGSVTGQPTGFNAHQPEVEDEHVGGSSPLFQTILKRVMQLNNYVDDPIVTSFPQLKSSQIQSKPSHLRLPKGQYVLDTLANHREHIDLLTRKTPDKKVYFTPPSTLERVAELGDPLRFTTKGSKQKVSVVKDVPLTPTPFYDIQKVKKSHTGVPAARVRFQPTEAKQMELSLIWALKSANYLDHFTQRVQSSRKYIMPKISVLADWSRAGLPVSSEVVSIISDIQEFVSEAEQMNAESEPLFKSIVDTLIYAQAMFQLARRDDLLQLVTNSVDSLTIRAMRISLFDGKYLFDESECEKALEQVKEAKKSRGSTNAPRRPFGNQGFTSRYQGYRRQNNQKRFMGDNKDFKSQREFGNRQFNNTSRNQGTGRGAARDDKRQARTPSKRGARGRGGPRRDRD